MAACTIDPLVFVAPGPLDRRTGGTIYDRRIVEGLRAQGRAVEAVELPGRFPRCDAAAFAAARDVLEAAPDFATVVIDGLALPAFTECLAAHAARLRVVALVHHPLALETGLAQADRAALFAIERSLLARVAGIVTTSPATARMLVEYDVDEAAVSVVAPGTDPAPPARGSGGGTVQLLCVAALIPRKGHALLFEALAGCAALPWRLLCLGSGELAAALETEIHRHGLAGRIRLGGAADDAALAAAYAAADIFVLASALEGYGMAFAEALAHGLPVVGSGAGAVRDTVPRGAGLIAPVGDRAALGAALSQAIGDPQLRARLAAGARAAGRRLPDWPAAARHFAAALDRAARR